MGWGQEDQDRQDEIDAACAALKAELSASQAREAALLEKLEAAEVKAKKILELEQRVKVLTEEAQSALDYLSDVNDLDDRCQWKQFVIAKDKLREAVRLTPQQTSAQIERWHIEWMMKLPVAAVGCSDMAKDGKCAPVAWLNSYPQDGDVLVKLPPLPNESNSPETDLDEALRRQ